MISPIFSKKIKLINPDFASTLTDSLIKVEKLRAKHLSGSTPLQTFMELKSVFHLLESLASARIEGNHTTVAEVVDQKIKPRKPNEAIQEINNIEDALNFIDKNINNIEINHSFIYELHKMIVKGLAPFPKGEGDKTPGIYRKNQISISKSKLVPPATNSQIREHIQELTDFINTPNEAKYDLLKTAISHHRFAAIHPFSNGNGRCVRALTYAMLLKQGYSVSIAQRIINPTAVFCNDRKTYYAMLARADSGKENDILDWCEFVITGLSAELEKIEKLAEHVYVNEEILVPAIDYALDRKTITEDEHRILLLATKKRELRAADVKQLFPHYYDVKISRMLKKMVDTHLLKIPYKGGRSYSISFSRGYLLRGVMRQLDKNGFIPSATSP